MMHAFNDLLSTDYGLMSLVVLAICIFMMVFIGRFVARQIRQDTDAHERALRESSVH